MKTYRLFSLFLLIAPGLAYSQASNYTVKGTIGRYNAPAKAYMIYIHDNAEQIDSAVLQNGSFEFKGSAEDPFAATLLLDYKGAGIRNLDLTARQDMLSVYIEPGKIDVTSSDSLAHAKVSGSKLNRDNQELIGLMKPVQAKMNLLNSEWDSAPAEKKFSGEFKRSLQRKYEQIQHEQKEILKKFIRSHPDSYVSLDVIKAIAGNAPEYSEIEPLFSSLSANIRQTEGGKELNKVLEQNKSLAIGALAPDFTEKDTAGKPVKLSDFKGKYVLLDFWASWCGPCRRENPNVVRVYNKYKDKNFAILGVSLDRGKEAWLRAIKDDGLTWTHVSDLKYWNSEVARQYNVHSIPQNFLLDPSGKIIAKNLRGEDLDRKLADLFD